MIEAKRWLDSQDKDRNGMVSISVVITESKRRGYCICPKPMRQMINFQGMTCAWCEMPETQSSWNFWYEEIENKGLCGPNCWWGLL